MSKENAPIAAPPKPAPGRGGPMGGGMMPGEKAKNFKGTMKSLLGYVKPYWIAMAAVFVFAIISTIFAIVSPKILGNMTTQVVNDFVNMKTYDSFTSQLPKGMTLPAGTTGSDLLSKLPPAAISKIPVSALDKVKSMDLTRRPSMDYAKLWYFVKLLVTLYLLSAAFSFLQGWIMTNISQKITFQFRKDISDKINRMPLSYFDTKSFGDVLSRVTNDVDTIGQTLNQSMTQIVTSVTMIVGILYMMFTISWQLTLVALITVPLSFVTIGFIVSKSQRYFKEQQASLGAINGHVEEMYAGHKIVKVFNGEKQSIATFNKINGKLYGSAWKSQFLSGLMMPLMNFFSNLGFVGVSVYGGYLAVKGSISIGDIQAFIQYVNQFNQPIMQTANIANVLQSTAAAAERVFEFLGEEEETPETTSPVVLPKVFGNVEFDNVEFGYKKGQKVIRNFTAKVSAGQRIAIVGPTGAGKTTMVNLLMRFYDVNKGAIRIDGVDIRDMKRADLRKMFGMVLQDTWLFHGTIRDNIAYGNLSASKKQVVEAAKSAHVDHFVHSLPNGYNMELSEEADNISQGEKQLMTIARAMLANPPMLILDEATSSVDTRTEVYIQKAMDKLMEGRTSFVIAHRLSTIKGADLILVMNDGNIVEQGKHDELISRNGFYAKLYNSQFTTPVTE